MITTTLARIQALKPSPSYWRMLIAGLGKTKADDEPLPFARIVEICGIKDALWCCHAEPQYAREWSLFAVWCARQVQHLMKDPRSVAALDAAERYARGEATDVELSAARTDAQDAYEDADADDCTDADMFATIAAYNAVHSVAWRWPAHAARHAAVVTHAAINAAAAVVTHAAINAAANAAQVKEFLRIVNETEARA
jgi:hypothetical protein